MKPSVTGIAPDWPLTLEGLEADGMGVHWRYSIAPRPLGSVRGMSCDRVTSKCRSGRTMWKTTWG